MTASIGQPAPDFEAIDQNGSTHRLGLYAGEWLLLYFYPKDNTPGCTKEACAFRDAFTDLRKVVTILGVSGDSIESHRQFAEKYNLPFPLLADADQSVITAYGTDGNPYAKRTSFLINPEGIVEKIYENIDVEEHAGEVLRDVYERRMQKVAAE